MDMSDDGYIVSVVHRTPLDSRIGYIVSGHKGVHSMVHWTVDLHMGTWDFDGRLGSLLML